jgi:hypothetical protein
MRVIRRAGIVAAVSAFALVGTAGGADAGQPAVQGCIGSTFSGGAQAARPVGQLVKTFAQADDGKAGLGDGIQALQAGVVGDDVVVNTCSG